MNTRLYVERVTTTNDRSFYAVKFLELMHEKDVKNFGESRSFHLKLNNDSCIFVPNYSTISPDIEQPTEIIPRDGQYCFVIVFNESTQKPQLRVGIHNGHFYLANKADKVLAAGMIHIKNHKLIKFDNLSGTYPTYEQLNESLDIAQRKYFIEVGLPTNLYQPVYRSTDNIDELFRQRNEEEVKLTEGQHEIRFNNSDDLEKRKDPVEGNIEQYSDSLRRLRKKWKEQNTKSFSDPDKALTQKMSTQEAVVVPQSADYCRLFKHVALVSAGIGVALTTYSYFGK